MKFTTLKRNHDFLLSQIPYFKNIRCFPLSMQPVCFNFGERKAYLAHGDLYLNWKYGFYTRIIRQPLLIKILDFFLFFCILKFCIICKTKIN